MDVLTKIDILLESKNIFFDDKKLRSLYKKLTGKATRTKIRDTNTFKALRVKDNSIATHTNGDLVLQIVNFFDMKRWNVVKKELKKDFIIETEDLRHGELWARLRLKTGKGIKDVEKEIKLPKTSKIKNRSCDPAEVLSVFVILIVRVIHVLNPIQ